MSNVRNAALEEAASIADRWATENKAAAAKARARTRREAEFLMEGPDMAEMLDGAAIECNAIAIEIRKLKS